jgi:metal-responsive CopG/Arc/MetJ family transcriptional regulator
VAKGQISFTCPEALAVKIDAEMEALGYTKRSEVVRNIVVKHFEEKEREARAKSST